MFDPVALALQSVALSRPAAFGLVFAAGVVTSIGPCMAPRLIAISSLSARGHGTKAYAAAGAFVAGLVVAYASFGLFASMLGEVSALSRWIYLCIAAGLAAGGVTTLMRQRSCAHSASDSTIVAPGAAFLLGGSFAFVISPCCTPLVVAILAYCTQMHNAAYGAGLLAVFALGHAVPVVALAGGTSVVVSALRRFNLDEAMRVVGGSLMLALCGYYLCLA